MFSECVVKKENDKLTKTTILKKGQRTSLLFVIDIKEVDE